MNKLLLATHNPAKIRELKLGLQELKKSGIKLVTLKSLKIRSKPRETGKTFRENAVIKARYYANLSRLPTVADDGGLSIPFLRNEPGVRSRRWLGFEASDEQLINYTLSQLKGVSLKLRRAYLETCICFYKPGYTPQGLIKNEPANPEGCVICEQEKIHGYIAEKPCPQYAKGFPYRALLIVKKFNKYYDELTEVEHQAINHRLKALKRLVKKIKSNIIK